MEKNVIRKVTMFYKDETTECFVGVSVLDIKEVFTSMSFLTESKAIHIRTDAIERIEDVMTKEDYASSN